MLNFKALLSILAITLTLVGYIPYIKSILKKQTTPHVYSWFIWCLDGFIIFGLQLTHGAGVGSFVAFTAGLLALTVLLLSFKRKADWDITRTDKIFSVLALVALGLWLIAKQPVLSAVLILIVDVFGFIPTVRKSWVNPYSENIPFYIINTIRFAIAFAALQEYSFITMFYPGFWFWLNGLFALMLTLRRRQVQIAIS